MRNSTILVLGLAFMAATSVGAHPASPLRMLNHAKVSNIADSRKKAIATSMKISEIASKLKPTVTKTYGWSGRKWMLDESITTTYDMAGNPVRELSIDGDGDYSNTVFEYDANGKVTFKESKVSDDGEIFDNSQKTQFEYDPILTNVITRRTEWLWMDLGEGYDWQLVGNNYKRTITRNDDGNITSIEIAVLFQGYYDPTQHIEITYGEDGKATSISEKLLNYDGKKYFWEDGTKITDIKWQNTDGQIYDPELIFLGNNRILSAHYEEDGLNADVTVEYAEDSSAYKATMQMSSDEYPVSSILEYTPLENGGYIMEGSTSYKGNVLYSSKEEVRYDDWGNLILSYESETEDDETVAESTVGTVEYDENGVPTSYTVTEERMYRTGEWESENVFRAEYFDYVDVTASVNDIKVDSDAPVRYYNLQGLPIQNPAKGTIVVRKQGTRVDKMKY